MWGNERSSWVIQLTNGMANNLRQTEPASMALRRSAWETSFWSSESPRCIVLNVGKHNQQKSSFKIHSQTSNLPKRRAEAFNPVLTCPMWRQFSNPITSIRWSPMSEMKISFHAYHRTRSVWISLKKPWMAIDRSTELKLCVEISLSAARSFLMRLKGPCADVLRRSLFWDKFSPQRFEPPCV